MKSRRLRLTTMGPVLIGLILIFAFTLVLIVSNRASAVGVQQAVEVSSRPIVSTAAELLFNPLYTLDVDALNGTLAQFVGETNIVYVGGRDTSGQMIAGAEDEWTLDESTSRELAARALAGRDFARRQTADYLILVSPIAVGSEQIGTVEFVFSQAPLRATLGTAQRTISITIVIAFIGAILIITTFARLATAPLRDLAVAAEEIGRGNLDAPVSIRGTEEMATLATAMEQMKVRLREGYANLEQRVAERTRGLQAVAEVSQATTSLLDPDVLLRRVVDLVRERFGLYYVGLFLIDEEEQYAVLRAGTGEAGRQMLERGHRLEVGGVSMIGQCVARNEPDIQLDVGEAAIRFDNPLLPDTRSELALPLRSRGRVIGAMTVQSAEEAAFDEAYVAALQTMADQVAVAIDNAQLFADTQAALRSLEATQRRYLGQAWTEYARGMAVSGYECAGGRMAPLGDEVLPQVRQAMAAGRPVVASAERVGEASPSTLVAPIAFGDRIVGALGFREGEGGRQWSEDDVALVRAISEQFAQAAENLRLLDETQRSAARERTIGEVSARMRESLELEAMLRTAASEMCQALDLDDLVIRLATPETGDDSV